MNNAAPQQPSNDLPHLERVLLPERHEFTVTVPDGETVHGYVPSYEVWDAFVRIHVAFIDRPLASSQLDGLALRLADGTFAKMVHGNGGGSRHLSVTATAFARPPTAQTATLGLGRDPGEPETPRVSRHSGEVLGNSVRAARKPSEDMLFTPIMDLQLP